MKTTRLVELPESDREWALYCDTSPDGRHYVYSIQESSGESFVCDGQSSPTYDMLLGPWYDENGTFLFKEGKPRKWRWHIRDEVHGAFEQSHNPVFSPDGLHHCYAARKGKAWTLVVDGKPRKEVYDQVGGDPVWSPDGKQLAFTAAAGSQEFVVVNGERQPPCVAPSNLAFSPDGSKLAYLVQAPPLTQYQVICGDFKSDRLDLPTKPKFTPLGDLVFSFSLALQIGNQTLQTQRVVEEAFFHPDGTLAGHLESDGRQSFLIRPGQAPQEFPNFHEAYFHPPDRFAIVADKMTQQEAFSNLAKRMVMCFHGQQSEEYDLLKHPRFSQDGLGITFGAVRDRDLYWVEIDGP